jgi:hypothetical protein
MRWGQKRRARVDRAAGRRPVGRLRPHPAGARGPNLECAPPRRQRSPAGPTAWARITCDDEGRPRPRSGADHCDHAGPTSTAPASGSPEATASNRAPGGASARGLPALGGQPPRELPRRRAITPTDHGCTRLRTPRSRTSSIRRCKVNSRSVSQAILDRRRLRPRYDRRTSSGRCAPSTRTPAWSAPGNHSDRSRAESL